MQVNLCFPSFFAILLFSISSRHIQQAPTADNHIHRLLSAVFGVGIVQLSAVFQKLVGEKAPGWMLRRVKQIPVLFREPSNPILPACPVQ